MERYTHVHLAALDDDVGFRTKGSEYIHEAYTGTFIISELHTATYYKLCVVRWQMGNNPH